MRGTLVIKAVLPLICGLALTAQATQPAAAAGSSGNGCITARIYEEGGQVGGQNVLQLSVLAVSTGIFSAEIAIQDQRYVLVGSKLVWVDSFGVAQVDQPATLMIPHTGTFHYLEGTACLAAVSTTTSQSSTTTSMAPTTTVSATTAPSTTQVAPAAVVVTSRFTG